MGFYYGITTKPLCTTISIFYGRCKEEWLFGFQVCFEHLPLLGLKPLLGLSLYIYTLGNYTEDFYYSSYLFYPTTSLTAFSVLTGRRNGNVIIHLLIILQLNKDFTWNLYSSMWIISEINFFFHSLFLMRNLNQEVNLQIYFQIVFLSILVYLVSKSILKNWMKLRLGHYLILPWQSLCLMMLVSKTTSPHWSSTSIPSINLLSKPYIGLLTLPQLKLNYLLSNTA